MQWEKISKKTEFFPSRSELFSALKTIHQSFPEKQLDFAELVCKKFRVQQKKLKTIAVLCSRLGNSGIARALANIIPIWVQSGYQILLVTTEKTLEGTYSFPDSVSIEYIEPHFPEFYIKLRDVLLKYQADAVFHQCVFDENYLWTAILTKELGLPFFAELHTSHNFAFENFNGIFSTTHKRLQLADRCVVLSRCFQFYYQTLGIKTWYIPNKTGMILQNQKVHEAHERFEIIWVGRPEDDVKQIKYIIDIMKEVSRKNKKIHLTVVGKIDCSYRKIRKLLKQYKKEGLQKAISFAGYSSSIDKFYQEADCFLSTSAVEGFPMAIFEAFSFGLPVVMFELPYLELTMFRKGFIDVPQRDVSKMANCILNLADSQSLQEKLHDEALSVAQYFINYDYSASWQDFFNNVPQAPHSEKDKESFFKMIIKTFYDSYEMAQNGFIVKLGKKIQNLAIVLKKIAYQVIPR